VFWPCPSETRPGTPRLFADRFAHADGLARFYPVRHGEPAETPDAAHPFYLTTGRVMTQYQSGTQTRRVPELAAAEPHPFVEVHPDTARSLHIAPDDMVHVTTRRGTAVLRARYSRKIRLDTLFVPFHWSGAGNANILTSNTALDPVSHIPEFKVCAASLEKVEIPAATTVRALAQGYE
jgi:assimilatory nitrate reductase catalytic subunit